MGVLEPLLAPVGVLVEIYLALMVHAKAILWLISVFFWSFGKLNFMC